jgi:2',3'-cyclic-nucleotide 2'-phosphodiesterase (5'-nucleotidase family)
MRTPWPLLATLLAPLLLSACRAEPPSGSLTVYYTASLRGNLDGCSCERNRVAGLVKRAAYLRTLPARGESIRLDAGDLLDPEADPDLAREILAVYRELGYDAVAVGEAELSNGIRALRGYLRRYPLLANNLASGPSESLMAPLTPGPLLHTRGGIRLGVFAVLEPEVLQGRAKFDEAAVRVLDPVATARQMLEACRRRGVNLVIALYHGSEAGAHRLALECPGLDLILFGHQNQLILPEKVGTALIASPGENGNRLGVLTLRLGPQGIADFEHRLVAFNFARDPDDPAVRRRVTAYRKMLQARLRAEDEARASGR